MKYSKIRHYCFNNKAHSVVDPEVLSDQQVLYSASLIVSTNYVLHPIKVQPAIPLSMWNVKRDLMIFFNVNLILFFFAWTLNAARVDLDNCGAYTYF